MPSLHRRAFLKTMIVGAGALAGTQVVRRREPAREPEGPAGQKHRWAMVIDLDKCTGCNYCTNACRAHNDIAPSISWNKLLEGEPAGDRPVFVPRPCMHCEHAPCVEVCPVKATYTRPDGIVMMDYDRCIGCRYCEVACPYYARSFNWEVFDGPNPAVPEWGEPEVPRRPRGVVEKCSFCFHRIDRGLENGLTPGVDSEATPACVVACPVGARTFGDLNDPDSPINQVLDRKHAHRMREELGTEPRIYYLCAEVPEEAAT